MHVRDFIAKWRANARSERAACQEHFIDLCGVLGEPTPNTDPTGATYAFEKGATKASGGDGWADVWRKERFAWEYKGKHKDLAAAHRQQGAMHRLMRLLHAKAHPWLHRNLAERLRPGRSSGRYGRTRL